MCAHVCVRIQNNWLINRLADRCILSFTQALDSVSALIHTTIRVCACTYHITYSRKNSFIQSISACEWFCMVTSRRSGGQYSVLLLFLTWRTFPKVIIMHTFEAIFLLTMMADWSARTLIGRFMGPTWGPFGADRTQVVAMLAPWTLLSGVFRACRSKGRPGDCPGLQWGSWDLPSTSPVTSRAVILMTFQFQWVFSTYRYCGRHHIPTVYTRWG